MANGIANWKSRSPRRVAKRRQTLCSIEVLEDRVCLTASAGWDGAGAGTANLTYTLSSIPANLNATTVTSAIERALSVWSSVADVNFRKVTTRGLSDSLDISFASIDGPGNV